MRTTTKPALTLTPHEIETVLTLTAEAVGSGYFLPDRGRAVAERLRAATGGGEYAELTDPADLASAVTEDMQAVERDLHLRLIFHSEGAVDPLDADAQDAFLRADAQRTAGGVRGVHRLDGDIALLNLAPRLSHPHYGGELLVSAMQLVADARALVLDLRDCAGGTPATAALICSYLLGPEPVHLLDVEEGGRTNQHWSHAWVPGRRFGPDKPLAVLVSGRTFSGGEELASDLQEVRGATVIGEQTRGGAHPRIGVRVHEVLEVSVPCARGVSPRTGTNWEGVGITPDLAVPAGQALDVALAHLGQVLAHGSPESPG
jgi:hypothetical protein